MCIRVQSWLFAAIFLLAFCWVGLLAWSTAPAFQGLESVMPLNTKLVVNYGPIACPILGVAAAIGLLLTDVHCRGKWIQPTLVLVLVVLVVYMFVSLLFSYFGPVPRNNKTVAVDPRRQSGTFTTGNSRSFAVSANPCASVFIRG